MARLIVKSPYYKCGGNTSLSGYLRYIATRERVELLPDDPGRMAGGLAERVYGALRAALYL